MPSSSTAVNGMFERGNGVDPWPGWSIDRSLSRQPRRPPRSGRCWAGSRRARGPHLENLHVVADYGVAPGAPGACTEVRRHVGRTLQRDALAVKDEFGLARYRIPN